MRLNNGLMKVIILNGSPKAHGNTATALHEVERTLQQQFGSPKIQEELTETHYLR